MVEIWKDIPEYKGYQASNIGRVRSCDRIVFNKGTNKYYIIKGKVLKQTKNNNGYYLVTMSINGKVLTKSVHRLVWMAFNGVIPEGYEINHLDCNCANNVLSNLTLTTHKENINWGSWSSRQKRSHLNRKDQSKVVLQFSTEGELIKEWPSASEIQRQLGFKYQSISKCCHNRQNTAYGYIWKFN